MLTGRQIKIALLMPTYSDIPVSVYRSHLVALLSAQKKGYAIEQIGIREKELICHARNTLFEAFLATNCTHALCLDNDVILPSYTLCALVEANFPVVTGIYFQKEPPYYPLIMAKGKLSRRKKGERGLHQWLVDWPENTIFPIDACGFGCILIEREIIEQIKRPWFAWTEESGEDIGFCVRLRKENIPIMCHSGIICGHQKSQIIGMEHFKSGNPIPSRTVRINADLLAKEEINNGSDLCKRNQEDSRIIFQGERPVGARG